MSDWLREHDGVVASVGLEAFDIVLGGKRAEFNQSGNDDTDADLDGRPVEYGGGVDYDSC